MWEENLEGGCGRRGRKGNQGKAERGCLRPEETKDAPPGKNADGEKVWARAGKGTKMGQRNGGLYNLRYKGSTSRREGSEDTLGALYPRRGSRWTGGENGEG